MSVHQLAPFATGVAEHSVAVVPIKRHSRYSGEASKCGLGRERGRSQIRNDRRVKVFLSPPRFGFAQHHFERATESGADPAGMILLRRVGELRKGDVYQLEVSTEMGRCSRHCG